MRFGSVCSGIEAASQAWQPLGWKAAWLSEIEPFPSALLAHHYPDTPNFGDMTKFESWPDDEQHAIDLLCGGTPCQSFSVAGLRKGLDDDRGNLMLTFAAIAAKYRPKWLVWENVPGVLSSNNGRDFASFLGLLSGQAIEPPKDGWGNSGIITGYKNAYSLAWRVLDAQYFGVAQRRRRVFVVGCLGANRSAAAVLFERHSLSGHPAPSRKKGQSIANCLTASAFSGGAGGRPEGAAGNHFIPTIIDRAAFNQGANALYEPLIEESETMPTIVARRPHAVLQSAARMVAFGEYVDDGTASTIKQRDYKDATDLVTYALAGNTIGRQPKNGGNGTGFSEDLSYTLTKADQHAVCAPITYQFQGESYGWMDGGTPQGANDLPARAVRDLCGAGCGGASQERGLEGSKAGELATPVPQLSHEGAQVGGDLHAVRQASQGVGVLRDALPTVQEVGRPDCDQRQPICSDQKRRPDESCEKLQGSGMHGQIPREGILQQTCPAGESRDIGVSTKDQGRSSISTMAVRRLLPIECERLQGFEDGYTNVPHRGKPAADGNRYKALGNSWAVPCAWWIGERIQMVEDLEACK